MVLIVPLPLSEKLVALALADFAHDDGTQARPAQSTVARMTGLSKLTVSRSMRRLEAMGVLVKMYDATNRKPAIYKFAVETEARDITARGQVKRAQVATALSVNSERSRELASYPKPLDNPFIKNHAIDLTEQIDIPARVSQIREALKAKNNTDKMR